jgi:DNA invertase Pin-like site-specific DNA recombinase
MDRDLIPAAQYLRMSTEHQQYSLENQAAAIQRYAEFNGFEIVRTYPDPAKSGVVLKRRTGLQQLLEDVRLGTAAYQAILVYDVSRWGRFQDTDESAYYEFLCKRAGIRVHYCSEIFANDGTLPSLIMKALKRTMAGEYSRELSVKVTDGHKRIAKLGFKQGGLPGYGLRRMLVSPNRLPKQLLDTGEHKSLATDRVILVPGPADEIRVVRKIYKMLILDGLSVRAIAGELNRRGIEYMPDSTWDYAAVYGILTQLKYIGCHVYGRTTRKLYTPLVRLPKSEWIVISNAFEPIVDYGTFVQAQQVLYQRSLNKSDRELLDGLRGLLEREGRLSVPLIERSPDIPSPSTYRVRFGSLRRAYELIEYGRPEQFGSIDLRRRTQALREELISILTRLFPQDLRVVSRGGRWRNQLQLRTGEFVSVLAVRSIWRYKEIHWHVVPVPRERMCVTLLARLNCENRTFLDFWMMPCIDRARRFDICENDPWLSRGLRLNDLSGFCTLAAKVSQRPRFGDSPTS